MRKLFKSKKIITVLLFVLLFIVLTFSFTAFAKDGSDTSNVKDKENTSKEGILNPLYWLIAIGIIIFLIILTNVITYYCRIGMYGDVKKKEKKAVSINKEGNAKKKVNKKQKPKKKESFLDSDVKTIMAGNRTIEIDKETCLVNNKKK